MAAGIDIARLVAVTEVELVKHSLLADDNLSAVRIGSVVALFLALFTAMLLPSIGGAVVWIVAVAGLVVEAGGTGAAAVAWMPSLRAAVVRRGFAYLFASAVAFAQAVAVPAYAGAGVTLALAGTASLVAGSQGRRALASATDELHAASTEECRRAFEAADVNDDDRLSTAELRILFKHLGLPVTTAAAEMVMREIDTDADGYCDRREFEAWFGAAR